MTTAAEPSTPSGSAAAHTQRRRQITSYKSTTPLPATNRSCGKRKVLSEPDALIAWFGSLGVGLERIGLEAGPLSQWLYATMKKAGLAVELLETRHVHNAFETMPVKTDRNDARGIV